MLYQPINQCAPTHKIIKSLLKPHKPICTNPNPSQSCMQRSGLALNPFCVLNPHLGLSERRQQQHLLPTSCVPLAGITGHLLGEVYHDSKPFNYKSWAEPSFSKLEGETHHVHSSPGDLLPQVSAVAFIGFLPSLHNFVK